MGGHKRRLRSRHAPERRPKDKVLVLQESWQAMTTGLDLVDSTMDPDSDQLRGKESALVLDLAGTTRGTPGAASLTWTSQRPHSATVVWMV